MKAFRHVVHNGAATRRRFTLAFFFILAWVQSSPLLLADSGGKKFALLVQNDAYPDAETGRAADDVGVLAAFLKKNGFEVELKRDLGRQELRSTIDAFVARITPSSVALFYYKGIGIQTGRLDYLIPVDGSVWSEDDVRHEGTRLDLVMSDLQKRGADQQFAIIDAARPNPFERRFRVYSAGLAALGTPQNSLVIFAEAVSRVGTPIKDRANPFMTELVGQLGTAPDDETAFSRTRERMAKLSKNSQVPWVSSTLVAPSNFLGSATDPSSTGARPATAGQGKPPSQPAPPSHAEQTVPPAVPKKPTDTGPAAAGLRPGATFQDCPRCPEMTILPAGTFVMGSGTTPFDRPAHNVSIGRPFAIALSVVTQGEWALCVEEKGCPLHPGQTGAGKDLPAAGISWSDATQYAAWLSRKVGKTYRLPTEAEWEYAARGGTTTSFPWGDALGSGHANCSDCGNKSGHSTIEPVKTYPKNGFGLYDMAGNVSQWLQDCWTPTYGGAPTDGSAARGEGCRMRAVRGGSFETSAAYIKPTARFRQEADFRSASLGFRLVREVP